MDDGDAKITDAAVITLHLDEIGTRIARLRDTDRIAEPARASHPAWTSSRRADGDTR
jgi:hypothetical protein